jgi:DNA-binding MarR family transcriptional regulator
MDAVFFSFKRAFHATLRCSRPVLARAGLTPARFDVLYALAREQTACTQAELRRMLGVARATMSEMLATLEGLGWIRRVRDRGDGRTRAVSLTAEGRTLLERAYEAGIGSGLVPLAVDSALSCGDAEADTLLAREQLNDFCMIVRRYFGDGAMGELYPWHPDEYLSGLELVVPGSASLLQVETLDPL